MYVQFSNDILNNPFLSSFGTNFIHQVFNVNRHQLQNEKKERLNRVLQIISNENIVFYTEK